MSDRLWGLGLILIGAILTWDGRRLWQDERADSMFDVLGPDRYIILMGGLLILTGIVIGLSKTVPAGAARQDIGKSYLTPAVFTVALSVYALIIPWLGYTGATFLFFVAAFFLAGRRNIVPTLVTSTISAACFYLLFPYLADMPLPRGFLGF